ncbi:cyclopropane-fatty-acyl-phospholipid synthase family protein [Streptacidiphilus sp. N1-10]|uniref:Cyclopropane-fatty-acyl-phospholipid synthase family protein n=1 Tax=Streptacidiphilus jeojiensis TaxID=3229225 RepID=A0ABV6XU07_9ACTN
MRLRPELPPTRTLLARIGEALPGVFVSAYDGCSVGPGDAATRIRIASPQALARILRAPRGLGLARAWVAGEIIVEGDLEALAAHEHDLYDWRFLTAAMHTSLRTCAALGYRGLRAAGATAIEYRNRRPGRHSVSRDIAETEFHYSLAPAFYRHLLGPSMTYSGALFRGQPLTLEQAQAAKHRLICEKLGLHAQSRVLDIGCGWGSFLLAAAEYCGSGGVGITASQVQQRAAAERLADVKGMEVLAGDYRSALPVSGITAATSIGMYEHVGERNSQEFFRLVRRSLQPGGRYLNQSITRSTDGPRRFRRNAFVQRYIFPNGQLIPLTTQLHHLEQARLRVVSVENFGADYATTLRHWIDNLSENWDACVRLEGEQRARAWQIYLVGSRRRFLDGTIELTQVLTEAY